VLLLRLRRLGGAIPGAAIPIASASSQAKASFFGRQEGAPEAQKSGAKVTPTDVGDEEMAESPPSVEEHPMEDNIEAPRPERWVQWLVGFHVAEEKKKKEEEGRGQEER